MNPVKVIFIDRQKMFVQGIMALADKIKYPVIKIAGQYSVTKYFLEDYDGGADIIAVDLNLEDSDGIDFIAQLRSDFPDQKVMVLSSYAEYKFVKDAMKKGFLTPSEDGKLKLTMSGEKFIDDVRKFLRKQKHKD